MSPFPWVVLLLVVLVELEDVGFDGSGYIAAQIYVGRDSVCFAVLAFVSLIPYCAKHLK